MMMPAAPWDTFNKPKTLTDAQIAELREWALNRWPGIDLSGTALSLETHTRLR